MLYTPTGEAPPPKEEDPLAIGLLEKAGLVSRKPTQADLSRKAALEQDPVLEFADSASETVTDDDEYEEALEVVEDDDE